tara:strand:- start:12 stop:833 length:822 start_codon:yes stop_codon:yes gene_type:complete
MFDRCIQNAHALGLPPRTIGVPWSQIIEIEDSLKKKSNNVINFDKQFEYHIIKLQNTYHKIRLEAAEKLRLEAAEKLRQEHSNKNNNINTILKYIEDDKDDKEDINSILRKIEVSNYKNKRKNNKLEIIKKEKNIKNNKKIKKKIDLLNKGDMDVIQYDKKTNTSYQYYYHLREQIISIEYDGEYDIEGFKNTLIAIILQNKKKIENIKTISKCQDVFFNTQFNYFKIIVLKNDENQHKKIINATMLISNMIAKMRETIEKSKIYMSKTALMI